MNRNDRHEEKAGNSVDAQSAGWVRDLQIAIETRTAERNRLGVQLNGALSRINQLEDAIRNFRDKKTTVAMIEMFEQIDQPSASNGKG